MKFLECQLEQLRYLCLAMEWSKLTEEPMALRTSVQEQMDKRDFQEGTFPAQIAWIMGLIKPKVAVLSTYPESKKEMRTSLRLNCIQM